jgi:hypothetical protein
MFVIYHKETTKFLRLFRNGYWQDANRFEREQDAKACLTRISKGESSRSTFDGDLNSYAIAEASHFALNTEKEEVRRGVGPCFGQEFKVKVNTPWCSGPWSETYHCS